MNHKYSTGTLLAIIFFILGALAIGISTHEIDAYFCNTNGAMLIRYNGSWICTTQHDFEEDLRFPVNMISTQGQSNLPEFDTFLNGTQALMFDQNTLEQGFISFQMPHGRLADSDLELHFHWSPLGTNTGYVQWCTEITCTDIDETFPHTTTYCINDTADGTAYKHQMTPYITITNTLNYSAQCQSRIYRNAPQDNYTGDAALHEVDLHYTAINIGGFT